MLLNNTIYKSTRFTVTGNIGYKLTITDLHSNNTYDIQYHELIKFRRYYAQVKIANRDLYLLAVITSKKAVGPCKTEPVIEKVA
jgi:hypothetical protein